VVSLEHMFELVAPTPTLRLNGLARALDGLLAHDAAGLPDDALVADVAGLVAARARLDAALAARLCVLEARGLPDRDAAPSARAWLRGRLRLSGAEAGRLLALARAVGSHPADEQAGAEERCATPGVTPATRAAERRQLAASLACGAVTAEQARLVAETCARAEGAAPRAMVEAGEALLLDAAATLDPARLRVVGDAWLEAVLPEAAAGDAAAAYERRSLHASPGLQGMVEVTGRLDPAGGAALLAVLDPLSRPLPDDSRTAAQRRADALSEACRRLLDTATLPEVGGEPPQLVLTVDTSVLDAYLQRRHPSPAGVGRSAHGSDLAPLAAGFDLPVPPRCEGSGGRPDWPTVLALACDAAVSRVVLGPQRQIEDMGRRTRVWTSWQRRGVSVRDQGCVWPRCSRPASWCQVDHIRDWAAGGPTTVDNARLLCSYHHHLRHEGWRLRGSLGSGWTAHPPPDWALRRTRRRRRRPAA
jgi:plasmid stabilization system protein ParE